MFLISRSNKKIATVEKLFVLMAMLLPLGVYRVPIGELNWSMDRLLLAVIIFFVPLIWLIKKASVQLPIIIAFGLMALFLAVFVPDDVSLFYILKDLPSYLQSYVVLMVTYLFLVNSPNILKTSKLIFLCIGGIILLFSIHGMFFYYISESSNYNPPFFAFFQSYFFLDEHKLAMIRTKRMFWPFATAPHLGFTAGFLSLFATGLYLIQKKIFWLLFGLSQFFVLCLSLSRGPLLSFIIAFSFMMFFGKLKKSIRVNNTLIKLFIFGLVFIVILSYARDFLIESQGMTSLGRITNFDIGDNSIHAHLMVRISSINRYLSSTMSEQIFGIGIGQTDSVMNISSLHMSFLTVLLEQGCIGFLFFIFVWGVPLMVLWRKMKKSSFVRPYMILLFSMALFLFLSHIVYNATSFVLLWFFLGFVYAVTDTRKDIVINAVLSQSDRSAR